MGMNHIIKFATGALEPDAMEEIAPEEWEDAWGEEEVAIGNHDQDAIAIIRILIDLFHRQKSD